MMLPIGPEFEDVDDVMFFIGLDSLGLLCIIGEERKLENNILQLYFLIEFWTPPPSYFIL